MDDLNDIMARIHALEINVEDVPTLGGKRLITDYNIALKNIEEIFNTSKGG